MCWKHETQFVTRSDDLIEGLMDNLRTSSGQPGIVGELLFFLLTPPELYSPGLLTLGLYQETWMLVCLSNITNIPATLAMDIMKENEVNG